MIDNTLIKTLRNLYKKQCETANSVDLTEDPRSLSGLMDISSNVMHRVSENTFGNKKAYTGSWIANRSLPLQLLNQKRLIVDLTVSELKKERPYDMPIDSLRDLVANGLVFLNIRDYDSEEKNDFPQLCHDLCAENLNRILNVNNSAIYIGSAVRSPIFNASLKWQFGANAKTIDYYQLEFYKNLERSYEAYKDELICNNDKNLKTAIFRGEYQNLTAASWHYAYLTAVKSKINPIFKTQEERIGIDELYKKALISGDDWYKNKSDRKRVRAAKDFLELAGELRTYHLIYTAPITGSWGSQYNINADEHVKILNNAVRYNHNIVNNEAWENFQLFLLGRRLEWGHPAIDDGTGEYIPFIKDTIFDKGKIDSIIELLSNDNDNDIKERETLFNELNTLYIKDDIPETKVFAKAVEAYNKMGNSWLYKATKKLNLKMEIELSTSKIFSAIDMMLALKGVPAFLSLLPNVKIKNLPIGIQHLLYPISKEKRIIYRIHQNIEK